MPNLHNLDKKPRKPLVSDYRSPSPHDQTGPNGRRLGSLRNNLGRVKPSYWRGPLAGFLLLLSGCTGGAQLPDCVVGKPVPSPNQSKLWAGTPPAVHMDVAIDGSGSMIGLMGSAKTAASWKAMLRGVSLAAASTGVPIKALRSGSGQLQPLVNVSQAADPCFFSGCGAYPPVSSSLDSLWKQVKGSAPGVPLKVMVSDLEVNDGEISSLVAAIKAHVSEGAVIGVLAAKVPFEGRVFNSQAEIIHAGDSQRPIYLLATGPRSQVHAFLNEVRTKAGLGGVPTEAMRITFLDEHVNRPTIKAASVQGVPPQAISSGLPIRLGSQTYSPAGQHDYQFARLQAGAQGVRLSSTSSAGAATAKLPDLALAQLEPVSLSGGSDSLGRSLAVRGIQLQGQQLVMELAIPPEAPAAALRAYVPRGQLPEDWWISWNRLDPTDPAAKDQTDGLLLLLTSLGRLLVETGATPAAAFCLAFSH
jgi:hypothetical protein